MSMPKTNSVTTANANPMRPLPASVRNVHQTVQTSFDTIRGREVATVTHLFQMPTVVRMAGQAVANSAKKFRSIGSFMGGMVEALSKVPKAGEKIESKITLKHAILYLYPTQKVIQEKVYSYVLGKPKMRPFLIPKGTKLRWKIETKTDGENRLIRTAALTIKASDKLGIMGPFRTPEEEQRHDPKYNNPTINPVQTKGSLRTNEFFIKEVWDTKTNSLKDWKVVGRTVQYDRKDGSILEFPKAKIDVLNRYIKLKNLRFEKPNGDIRVLNTIVTDKIKELRPFHKSGQGGLFSSELKRLKRRSKVRVYPHLEEMAIMKALWTKGVIKDPSKLNGWQKLILNFVKKNNPNI